MMWLNQLEPKSLLKAFGESPPDHFEFVNEAPVPVFIAPFNLLTTLEDNLKRRIERIPYYSWWSNLFIFRTAFVGTTVSEYVLLKHDISPEALLEQFHDDITPSFKLTIIKDIPQCSPLLSAVENQYAASLIKACISRNYILIDGQALAYVDINFTSIHYYLSQLSPSRRKNLRRKLRTRNDVLIKRMVTGEDFINKTEAEIQEYYALYESVYAQSEIHFDHLSYAFLRKLLLDQTHQGIVFEYRNKSDNILIGWNLCYEYQGKLIDKYIGLRYPEARKANLYFLSWIVNLEYAIEQNFTHYIAGWTDPEVKASLGAQFSFTQHAVFIRNPILRSFVRQISHKFENDRNKLNVRK